MDKRPIIGQLVKAQLLSRPIAGGSMPEPNKL